jgi:hypothetical protein
MGIALLPKDHVQIAGECEGISIIGFRSFTVETRIEWHITMNFKFYPKSKVKLMG